VKSGSFRHLDSDSHDLSPESSSMPLLAEGRIPAYYHPCQGWNTLEQVREGDIWDFGDDFVVDYESIFTGMSDEQFPPYTIRSNMIENRQSGGDC